MVHSGQQLLLATSRTVVGAYITVGSERGVIGRGVDGVCEVLCIWSHWAETCSKNSLTGGSTIGSARLVDAVTLSSDGRPVARRRADGVAVVDGIDSLSAPIGRQPAGATA